MLGRVAGGAVSSRGWRSVPRPRACSSPCSPAAARHEAVPTLPPGFQDELVTPIDRPMAVAFVPGGRILIARFPGVVRLFKNGSLDPVATPALTISAKTCSDGERGLMSVAVDPAVREQPLHLPLLHVQEQRQQLPDGLQHLAGESRVAVRARRQRQDRPGQRGRPDRRHPGAGAVPRRRRPAVRQGRLPLHQHRRRWLRLAGAERLPGRKRRVARPARAARQGPADHARRRDPGHEPLPGRRHRALQRDRPHDRAATSARRPTPGACATPTGSRPT